MFLYFNFSDIFTNAEDKLLTKFAKLFHICQVNKHSTTDIWGHRHAIQLLILYIPSQKCLAFNIVYLISCILNFLYLTSCTLYLVSQTYLASCILLILNIASQKYVIIDMLSIYYSCNINLILKSYVGLIFIRVVPSNT